MMIWPVSSTNLLLPRHRSPAIHFRLADVHYPVLLKLHVGRVASCLSFSLGVAGPCIPGKDVRKVTRVLGDLPIPPPEASMLVNGPDPFVEESSLDLILFGILPFRFED